MTVLTLRNGYNRKETGTYRTPVDVPEMIAWCRANSHITFLSNDGTSRTAKVNGQVRTWKRDANRVEVPIKYGMYEYGTFTAWDIGRVLIPVTCDCKTVIVSGETIHELTCALFHGTPLCARGAV